VHLKQGWQAWKQAKKEAQEIRDAPHLQDRAEESTAQLNTSTEKALRAIKHREEMK